MLALYQILTLKIIPNIQSNDSVSLSQYKFHFSVTFPWGERFSE